MVDSNGGKHGKGVDGQPQRNEEEGYIKKMEGKRLRRKDRGIYVLEYRYEVKSVATYPLMEVQAKIQSNISQKGKYVGVATNVYSRKMLEKLTNHCKEHKTNKRNDEGNDP